MSFFPRIEPRLMTAAIHSGAQDTVFPDSLNAFLNFPVPAGESIDIAISFNATDLGALHQICIDNKELIIQHCSEIGEVTFEQFDDDIIALELTGVTDMNKVRKLFV